MKNLVQTLRLLCIILLVLAVIALVIKIYLGSVHSENENIFQIGFIACMIGYFMLKYFHLREKKREDKLNQ